MYRMQMWCVQYAVRVKPYGAPSGVGVEDWPAPTGPDRHSHDYCFLGRCPSVRINALCNVSKRAFTDSYDGLDAMSS